MQTLLIAGDPSSTRLKLTFFSLRNVEPEEIALVARLHVLLKQKHQITLVEDAQPRIP
jgi:hypothetical protein